MSVNDFINQKNNMDKIIKKSESELNQQIQVLKDRDEEVFIEEVKIGCYKSGGHVTEDGESINDNNFKCVMDGNVWHKNKCITWDNFKNEFVDKKVCNKPYLELRDGKCVLKQKPYDIINCHYNKNGLRLKKTIINEECVRNKHLKRDLNFCGPGLMYDSKERQCVPNYKDYCKSGTIYDRRKQKCVFKE